ncbi:ATP-grasp domain-containing protein [Streptomyces aurantiacus]|uniref:ATP-grasp domain-containing protein n=1 Tax=Streptomyces aurantiacus TaxID=47760 RepID=UPI00068E1B5B|nr:ATP-grasp domain-containing protein [Streptomyces aurantiacus]
MGTALAAELSSTRCSVDTSVLCHGSTGATPPGDFFCVRLVERDSEPAVWIDRAREIHSLLPVDRVVAFGESEQIVAAIIAEDLGLPGHHGVDVVRSVADKLEMRERLSGGALGTVAFAEAQDPLSIERFAHAHPESRWLVKPAMGTGSRGVIELVDLRHCTAAFNQALEVAHPVAGSQRVMVEELKPGRQLSVESFSEDGQHRVLAITQKYTDERTFAEVGHCVPAELSPEDVNAVAEYTGSVLGALRVHYGPTHTELVLGAAGRIDLIETHTRLGGHGIPHLVSAALGFDMHELAFAQLAGAPLLPRLPVTVPRATSAQAVWFGYAPVHGRVHSLQRRTEPEAHVEMLVSPGDEVTADMTRSSRVVAARASGATGAEAVRKASQAVLGMTLVVECSMTAQLLDS